MISMDTAAIGLWLALSLLPELGSAQLKSLQQLLAATAGGTTLTETAARAAGMSPALWHQLDEFRHGRFPPAIAPLIDRCLRWAGQPNHHLLTWNCAAYPPLLREIAEPPPVLFVAGSPDVLALPQLGIVGSRSPTADGRKNARQFAAQLVAAGYQITSGLALGIDAESHRGALDCHGVTIAVLGSGLDCIYPPQNSTLAASIVERGALVSEFLPDAVPEAWHFPRRNRIISGLAHGVLVVEAAKRSGSLITARLAAEQGREVFVIPGSIHNPMARGCHLLIRQGAKLVETVEDVLEELPPLLCWEQQHAAQANTAEAVGNATQLSDETRHVLACIAYDPVPVDMLVLRSGLALPELYAQLLQLEMLALIERQAAGYVLSRR
jgi:DNA processing protein